MRHGDPARRAVWSLGVYNLVQNFVVPDRCYVRANLAAAASLVVGARRSGISFQAMGLSPRQLSGGMRSGGMVAAAVALFTWAVSTPKRWDHWFRDERVHGHDDREARYRSAVRFPLGTALFEEVAFRGVLDALWRRRSGDTGARLITAATFGAWHLVPTFRDYRQMAGRRSEDPEVGERLLAALGGAILTGVSGVGFTALRERSGSVAAPWLAHAALNTSAYLAARRAWRRAGQTAELART